MAEVPTWIRNIILRDKDGDTLNINPDGSLNFQIGGSLNAREPFSGNTLTTHTFSRAMNGFVISNDSNADLTFTIDGDTFTVKAGEVFSEKFAPFTAVEIAAAGEFRAYGLGE